jgi:DNA primase
MNAAVEQIENVCRTHDMRSVLGWPAHKKTGLCPLPTHIHKKNTPSFSVFWKDGKQWWRCHGMCNTEGDIVDLIGFLRVPGYQRYKLRDRRAAAEIIDQRFELKVVIPEVEVTLVGDEWRDFLPMSDEALAYARTRGLTPETCAHFRFGGHGHYLTLPCFEDGRLRGIKLRNTQPTGLKGRFWQWPGSKQGLFNADAVRFQSGAVFVVKGEIPAALLHQLGYPVCAPTGGEGGWSERWRTWLALANKVVIGDNDGPGLILAEKRALLLGGVAVYPPPDYKDIDEFILADPDLARRTLDGWREQYKEV